MGVNSSRGSNPPFFSSRQHLTAAQLNRLVKAVRRELRISGANGIRVVQRGDRMVVEPNPDYQYEQMYRVKAIRVNGTIVTSTALATVTGIQSTISYDITAYEDVTRPDRTDVTPDLGRVEDDNLRIRSAAVGSPVKVYSFVEGAATDRSSWVEIKGERLDAGEDCPEPAP